MFTFFLLCLWKLCEMYSRGREKMPWGDEKDRSPSSERERQDLTLTSGPVKWTLPCTGCFKAQRMSHLMIGAALASGWLQSTFQGSEQSCTWKSSAIALMWLSRLWIQQNITFVMSWALRKMWMQLFQPQSPHNIINSNIILQRFAATLDIWYLWRLADFPPGFANCGHRWLIARQLSINNQTWTKSSALQGARPCVWLPCISGTLESPELCRLLILITVV